MTSCCRSSRSCRRSSTRRDAAVAAGSAAATARSAETNCRLRRPQLLLRGAVLPLERRARLVRIERRAVLLARELDVLPRLRLSRLRGEEPLLRDAVAVDRRLLVRSRSAELDRVADPVVDLLVDPDPADQQEHDHHEREQLLALRRVQLLDVNARRHRPTPSRSSFAGAARPRAGSRARSRPVAACRGAARARLARAATQQTASSPSARRAPAARRIGAPAPQRSARRGSDRRRRTRPVP